MRVYQLRILHYVEWNGGNQLCVRNDTGARCRYVLQGFTQANVWIFL
jgi:hypothetical protein